MNTEDAVAAIAREIDHVLENLPTYAEQAVTLSDALEMAAYCRLDTLLRTGVVSNISRPYFILNLDTVTVRVGFEVGPMPLDIWMKTYDVGKAVVDRLRRENGCDERD